MTTCESCVTRNAAAGVESTPDNVAHYVGEANRSPAERSAEHLQDLKDKKEDSHMWAHKLLEHPDEEEVKFSMKVLKKHSSAFQRQVMEAVVIEMRQNGNILNSKSGYNRCLIPRLSVSVGDRVQEEIVRKTDYNTADVDNILSKERCRKKVRYRTDDDEDKDGGADTPTTAPAAEPPLNKRRKYKPQRLVQNKSSKMPEEKKGKDKEGLESLEKKDSHDQQEPVNSQHNLRKDGQASNSDQKYFPLFSQSIARSSEVKREKGRPRKPKIIPKYLIIFAPKF